MMNEVTQAVEDTTRDIINSNVHTSMPGEVLEVDEEKGLITVKPIGSFYCDGQEMAYPIISGVPVCVTYASENIAVCVPIKVGDTCLLIFAEQSISAWITETTEAQTDERFELTNCIAVPGLRKVFPDALKEANEKECAVLQCGETTRMYITQEGVEVVTEGKVKVDAAEIEAHAETVLVDAASTHITGDTVIDGSLTVGGAVTAPSAKISGNINCGSITPGSCSLGGSHT